MGFGFSTSPYDQDRIVSGEAKLIRSAVNPLVSTVFSLRRLHPEPHLCIAYSRLVRETNKGKRFESFLSSACDILLVFYIQLGYYTLKREKVKACLLDFCKKSPFILI